MAKQDNSWTFSVEHSEGLDKLKEEMDKRHEEIQQSIEDKMEELCEQLYRDNRDTLASTDYPNDFKAWIYDVFKTTFMDACRIGWNLCYDYHKERIERP